VIKIKKYIAKRLLILIPVLFGVSLIVFMMIRLIPGDPARVIMGPKARPESIQLFHERYGLDKPVAVQYALWLGHMLQGDMGDSLRTHTPVLEELSLRLPHTLELAATSFLVGATLGIGFGILASVYRNSPVDYATMVAALAGLSVPIFWLGLLLIFLFSVTLGWLPTGGRMGYQVSVESRTSLPLLDSLLTANWQALIDLLKHLLMPTVTLATPIIAVTARMTRSSMLEVRCRLAPGGRGGHRKRIRLARRGPLRIRGHQGTRLPGRPGQHPFYRHRLRVGEPWGGYTLCLHQPTYPLRIKPMRL
jgi:ABC-type dipeptide/oligopeptide/nickel transport system permease component